MFWLSGLFIIAGFSKKGFTSPYSACNAALGPVGSLPKQGKWRIFPWVLWCVLAGVLQQTGTRTAQGTVALSQPFAHTIPIAGSHCAPAVRTDKRHPTKVTAICQDFHKSIKKPSIFKLKRDFKKVIAFFWQPTLSIQIFFNGYCYPRQKKLRSYIWHFHT